MKLKILKLTGEQVRAAVRKEMLEYFSELGGDVEAIDEVIIEGWATCVAENVLGECERVSRLNYIDWNKTLKEENASISEIRLARLRNMFPETSEQIIKELFASVL